MRFPLPLALVAAMVAIAAGIEIVLAGAPDLTVKLPLTVLLVWSLVRSRRARNA